jgi:uncharacterized surface protein with fasciclin (FAS1) repeats
MWFFVLYETSEGGRTMRSTRTYETSLAVKNILDTIAAENGLQTLLNALETTGLEDTLRKAEAYTFFAPVDDAFKDMSPDTFRDLFADKQLLTDILKYHIVPGIHSYASLKRLSALTTLQGSPLMITAGNNIMLNNSKIVKADIECSNGIIHTVDLLLVPRPKTER